MKKLLWFILSMLAVFTPLAFADGACGVVSTKLLSVKPDEYRLILTNVGKNARRINGQATLKPGKHSLKVMVVKRSSAVNSNFSGVEYSNFQQLSEQFDFELEVKANKFYRLVAQIEDKAVMPTKRRYRVKVVNELDKPCDDVNALERPLNVLKRVEMTLPNDLQYRLSLLMKDVREHYRKAGVTEPSVQLLGLGGTIDVLGIVVDYQEPAKSGLKILAVSPASAAANIGLKPDDVIVKVNELIFENSKMNHQQMTQAFKVMFNHLTKDNPAVITVNRAGESIEVNADYEQVSIPKYEIQLQLD